MDTPSPSEDWVVKTTQNNMHFLKFNEFDDTLCSLDDIYREINEYNATYWSKFLMLMCFTFGSIIVLSLNIVFFKQLPKIIYIMVIYMTICYVILFLFTIFTAASVNTEANKSYKLLNIFYTSNMDVKIFKNKRIKVNILIITA